MSFECIKDARLEDTGFNYTMSLIQGKYKMFILYALMGYGVVRFNEMKKYIGGISYKTLSYAEGAGSRRTGAQRGVSADPAEG